MVAVHWDLDNVHLLVLIDRQVTWARKNASPPTLMLQHPGQEIMKKMEVGVEKFPGISQHLLLL